MGNMGRIVKTASLMLTAMLLAAGVQAATREENSAEPIIGQEDTVVTDAPNVPPPIKRDHATKVVIHLEIKEVEGRLADGVSYMSTFYNPN